MFVRIISFLFAAAGLLYSLFIFDAAATAQRALQLAQGAAALETPRAQQALLANADLLLKTSWSRPLDWHAGALETKSWTAALNARTQATRPSLLRESASAATSALRKAPIQPVAWMRLAAIDEMGASNPLCAAAVCLERSWRAGPLLPSALACDRIRIAHAAQFSFIAEGAQVDPRLDWYAAARPSPRSMMACLSFLSPESLFAVMLKLRSHQAVLQPSRPIPPSTG